jgi:hypothetical protein
LAGAGPARIFDKTDAQPALHDRIKAALESGDTPLTTDRLVAYEHYTTLSHLMPMPEVGDAGAAEEIIQLVDKMMRLIHPLVEAGAA